MTVAERRRRQEARFRAYAQWHEPCVHPTGPIVVVSVPPVPAPLPWDAGTRARTARVWKDRRSEAARWNGSTARSPAAQTWFAFTPTITA